MSETVQAAWRILGQMAPFLLLGFLVAGLLHAYVPQGILARAIGGHGFGSILRATLIGVPLPLCSCGVVPVAVELRQRGASRGAVTAFLISTPETGVDSIAASFSVLHPLLAVARPVLATVTALLGGLVVEVFGKPAGEPVPAHDCCAEAEPRQERKGLVGGLRYAFVDLFEEVGVWLVPAILVSAALTALLDPGAVAQHVSSPWLQMTLMLLVGIPIYVCATAATPLAAALIASGFSPGAALVFLLVGPATNVVTIVAAKRMFGLRGAVLYVLVVAGASVLGGVAVDALFASITSPAAWATGGHDGHAHLFDDAAAIVLLLLIARVWWAKLVRR